MGFRPKKSHFVHNQKKKKEKKKNTEQHNVRSSSSPPPHISLLHLSNETMANKIFHEEKQGLQGGKCIALSNPNADG
jgi:hypothetical protein